MFTYYMMASLCVMLVAFMIVLFVAGMIYIIEFELETKRMLNETERK